MNAEDYEIAMVDIGLGRSWEECRLINKTVEKKSSWDRLVADFEYADKKGYLIVIPSN